jgi:DNA repair protein REV1
MASTCVQGSAEVSSANYLARRFGVHADMRIGDAKRLCPQVIVVPYEFEKYQVVSDEVRLAGGVADRILALRN